MHPATRFRALARAVSTAPVALAVSTASLLLPASAPAETVVGKPDAYVEYVEATGTQYIDTGVNAQTGLKARIDMEWADGGAKCDWGFLGAKDASKANDASRVFLYHGYRRDAASSFCVAFGYGAFGYTSYNPGYGTRHEIVSDFTDLSAIQIQWNGTNTVTDAVQKTRAGYGSFDLGLNLYLFAINLSGSPANYGKGKLYELRIFKKDEASGSLELLRHYLPCVKNGRAGLYDKANGTVSFSSGDADFVAGPTLAGPGEMVEWVESDGSKISIDTRVVGKIGIKSAVDATLLENSGDHAILAARGAGASTNYRIYPAYHNGGFFCYGDGALHQPKNVKPVSGTRYQIESDLAPGTSSVKVNGTELGDGKATGTAYFSTGLGMHLFCNNHMGAGLKNFSKVRFYSAKIWDGDELLRDFAPCVDTDGVAGLYDAVSERVFRPAVAFDLATQVGGVTNWLSLPAGAKPDTRIEWIESDGASDYFDLGIEAKDGVSLDAQLEWVEVPSDKTFVGAGLDTSHRFFLLQYSGNRGFHVGYATGLYSGNPDNGVAAETGVKYHVSSRLDAKDQFISVRHKSDGDGWAWDSVEGGRQRTEGEEAVSLGIPLYLFARDYNGAPDLFCAARAYSVKIGVKPANGAYAPARDLVPVKYGGKAMFWDRVTETFLRNRGRYLATGGGAERPFDPPLVVVVR